MAQLTLARIAKTKKYRTIRKSLIDQLTTSGNDTPNLLAMVDDYMKLYAVIEIAYADIQERGTYVEWRNSDTQYGTKKNDSVDVLLRTNAQMIKLAEMLGVSPIGNKDIDDDEL